jgi:hypothetical protein
MPPRLPLHQLTRHAVCLGMTGAGETGRCIGILEDLARAGVPMLALDPKGDLALNRDPTPEPYAGRVPDPHATAAAWQAGLVTSGPNPSYIAASRESAEVTVLTPGPESGAPVDVISPLTSPPPHLDADATREHTLGAVSASRRLIGHTTPAPAAHTTPGLSP